MAEFEGDVLLAWVCCRGSWLSLAGVCLLWVVAFACLPWVVAFACLPWVVVTPTSLTLNLIASRVKFMNYLINFEGYIILYCDIYKENKLKKI